MSTSEPKWLQNMDIIDKHLQKNEKWLQYPDKKAEQWEMEIDAWNDAFLKQIVQIENVLKKIGSKLEE
ncbi:hypothetical protein J32TS6_28800 [Virgibacillus pantothenticus]|uniref:Uncharacterized protein n=1 Tax=Virgibacillus pantothenticus TaxID=1473 RepID=A0A0L0QU10_VIRPA|nr:MULTISPECIES: hypothetical protein [Virgibacillus]API90999.1 hypothetical protein BKP57_03500 [Virgibacillus sp. 6R]KNE22041.1 hypothetical protein AFK71_04360 [Virgibacillus pantothenticus]MBS7428984.1 hypothetical protein [Virgibacillus sp. 19R1-5]MBU8566737.1 hypothetical protein [Virgibacillus pantothenticus]MBU8600320.1 hypothetical protein [Virgibacillus pantothenticus]